MMLAAYPTNCGMYTSATLDWPTYDAALSRHWSPSKARQRSTPVYWISVVFVPFCRAFIDHCGLYDVSRHSPDLNVVRRHVFDSSEPSVDRHFFIAPMQAPIDQSGSYCSCLPSVGACPVETSVTAADESLVWLVRARVLVFYVAFVLLLDLLMLKTFLSLLSGELC